MTISIHLISVPSDEVVTSRVVYLPKTGGEFGRATSCDISLPDQSKRISRVHGSIRLTDNGYSVKSTGQNSAVLNDKSMAKGKEYPLSDGDILKVENYTMLVSTLITSEQPQDEKKDDELFSEPFSLQLDNDDIDFLEEEPSPVESKKNNHFSEDNILSDDPFAADPFEDLDEDLIAQHVEVDDINSKVAQNPEEPEFLPVHSKAGVPIEASLEKLLSMTEKNNKYLRNPTLHHEALFDALEKTVDQFLNEFAPTQLERQFSDYISGGMFTNKEKKYWKIYRKHFQHRQENGDFRRQFKALFMENMQKQREES
ncbi:FHA domain-containing protein [Vibrio sp. Isolate25]|uniref:FHA domain-containing protein n=1 Tax=unclassified Vibrio TaxID=2614977 RepID=UPI001EFE9052|nr:FHA domain-containing protein [Vibrio sp. Isolate25]MCG9679053.1 FHA domain-containing protein [Vibrio sp. Isolate24]MCG9682420.1 FHA domain-containing protein [Vibrio sp. Isolate23]